MILEEFCKKEAKTAMLFSSLKLNLLRLRYYLDRVALGNRCIWVPYAGAELARSQFITKQMLMNSFIVLVC